MFEPLGTDFLDLNKRTLVHLHQSLNEPTISPGSSQLAQPARGYLMAFRNLGLEMEIFVGLWFRQSQQRILYGGDVSSLEAFPEKLSQAEAFLNEMGFLMDNTRFHSATPSQKADLIRTLPFVYRDMEIYLQALTNEEVQAQSFRQEKSSARDKDVETQQTFLDRYAALIGMI